MKIGLAVITGLMVATAVGPAVGAEENVERLAQRDCMICHGPGGNATAPLFPSLAGQGQDYMVNQLTAFQAHSRGDRFAKDYMWGVAGWLSKEQITQLAAYYSAQAPAPGVPGDPALTAKGHEIYDKGDPARGNAPCQSCHGENGSGIPPNPRLAGQNPEYLIKQLRAIINTDERPGAAPMHAAIHDLTPEEEFALATYLRALPGTFHAEPSGSK
jgi:cytochrome c553